jgi:uncharacterized protein YegL
MYENKWSAATPGCLVFLVDQSTSMSADGKAANAAKVIQSSIIDVLISSIKGEEIRPRANVVVIGYGGANEAKVIRHGWIEEWAEDLLAAKDNGTCIIPAEADGLTPMAEAFSLAKDIIDAFIQDRASKNAGISAPIVINITDGMPTIPREQGDMIIGETGPEADSIAKNAAEALMNTSTPDGNVLLMNAHISNEGSEVVCPSDLSSTSGSHEAEFLFSISSPLTPKMITMGKNLGFNVSEGCKGFVANARKSTLPRFIEMGSTPTK